MKKTLKNNNYNISNCLLEIHDYFNFLEEERIESEINKIKNEAIKNGISNLSIVIMSYSKILKNITFNEKYLTLIYENNEFKYETDDTSGEYWFKRYLNSAITYDQILLKNINTIPLLEKLCDVEQGIKQKQYLLSKDKIKALKIININKF